jgi:HD-GYP domain-containing protein (c-di-GMP phosphodiesterase class II)
MDGGLSTQSTVDPNESEYLRAVTKCGDKKSIIASQAIYSANGIKLLDTGARIDSRVFERLFQHSLREPLDQSITSTDAIGHKVLIEGMREVLEATPLLPHFEASLGTGAARIWRALGDCPLPPAIALRLTVARETASHQYRHALRSVYVALFLGVRAGFSDNDLAVLAISALLHDVGMMHVDSTLFVDGQPLSVAARRALHSHPLTAEIIVRREPQLSPMVAMAVAQHHERLDGTGYPRGLADDAICRAARVLMLVEIVCAVIESNDEAPDLRLSTILRLNRGSFDSKISALLLNSLPRLNVADSAGLFRRGEFERIMALFDYWSLLRKGRPPEALSPAEQEIDARLQRLERWIAETGVGSCGDAALSAGDQAAGIGHELQVIASEAYWHVRQIALDVSQRWPAPGGDDAGATSIAAKWFAAVFAGGWTADSSPAPTDAPDAK